MLQWIKEIFCNKNSRGFSLIEAMVATAIMGVGFTGTYTLVMLSERSMRESVIKQKLQMQADQILSIIESDLDNIDDYTINLTDCVAPVTAEKSDVRAFEWCSRLDGELGAADDAETRSVTVTTLGGGQRVVHILLEAGNGNVQVVMKRVFDL